MDTSIRINDYTNSIVFFTLTKSLLYNVQTGTNMLVKQINIRSNFYFYSSVEKQFEYVY